MKSEKTTLNIKVAADCDALARRALALFINTGRETVEKMTRFCVAISRCTPVFFFKQLESVTLSKSIPVDKILLFWVDECFGCRKLEKNNYKPLEHIFISNDAGFFQGEGISNTIMLRNSQSGKINKKLWQMFEGSVCQEMTEQKRGQKNKKECLAERGKK